MKINQIKAWIKEKRKNIIDPDDQGYGEDYEDEEQEFNERQQVELQFLDELEDFINN